MCNSTLTPHSLETVGRTALDTTRDDGYIAVVSATVSGSPRLYKGAIALAIHQAVISF
ncbi:MAG: hypothetical protein ACYTX0_40275 [Nostoc sp.]